MGREVRRVPAEWDHPCDRRGHHIPLFESKVSHSQRCTQYDAEKAEYEANPPKRSGGMPFEEWNGPRPVKADYMPYWPMQERTHYQMYETTSEGTPISPVMETPEELAKWLYENKASAFGRLTASYEHWLTLCADEASIFSCAIDGGRMISGVQAHGEANANQKV